jgi:hypothetical protein
MSAIRLYVAEALEPRMLLAAHPAHPAYSADYLPNGVLNVNGNPRQANVIVVQVETAAPDQFVVFIDGSPVPIAGAPAVTPTPTPASSPTPTPSPIPAGFGVEASLVSLIVVRGGSQGDNIQIGETDANGITTGVPSYIVGGAGDDTLTGGSGNDTIFGGPGNDVISDGSGSDVIDGGSGNDIIRAGDGNDTITGDVGNDIITVQAPQTAVLTTQPSDFLDGGAGNDVILAGVGDDLLFGGPGNDSLVGGSGNDTMLGGAGRDTLVGGTGHDEMFGGPGKDQFVGLATLDVVEDHQVGEGPLQKTANTTPTPTPTTSPSGTIATAKAGDGSVQTAGGHAGGIGDPVITYVISTGAVNSFLIQDSIGAIEVSDSTYMPAVGNTVGVTGQVTSPNGLYQFEGPTSVTTTGSTMTQPAAQTFTAATLTNGSSAGLALQRHRQLRLRHLYRHFAGQCRHRCDRGPHRQLIDRDCRADRVS